MRLSRSSTWLARLSDPAGVNSKFAPVSFDAADIVHLEALIDLAGRHNVRPVFVRNLRTQLSDDPASLLSGASELRASTTERLLNYANDRSLLDFGRAALLSDIAREIVNEIDAASLRAVLVKGLDFANVAYGGIHARTFSDIDLLVHKDAVEGVGTILRNLGFREVVVAAKRMDHTERGWTRRDAFGGITLVEVHTDMVHSPELRAAQSLTYDLYAGPQYGGITPAARLVLAGLHGATSHLFGRLQYVVDGLMIARMGVDPDELIERAKRSNASLPVVTMLRLAAEIFDCAVSRELAQRLRWIPGGRLESLLIPAPMVLSAKDTHRWRHLPQRHLYRLLLRMGGNPQ